MELEEAIKILNNYLCEIHIKLCSIGAVGIPNKEYFAIETVLNELKKYRKGEIISIKVLEDYYLVSKDKEKQMTLANKELFKEYVPKKIVDKQEKMIELMAEYIAKIDNDTEICQYENECDENCNRCVKQYFEKKAEETN